MSVLDSAVPSLVAASADSTSSDTAASRQEDGQNKRRLQVNSFSSSSSSSPPPCKRARQRDQPPQQHLVTTKTNGIGSSGGSDCSDQVKNSNTGSSSSDMVHQSEDINGQFSADPPSAGGGGSEGSFDPQLYSRQLYVLGEKAMHRLRMAKVLISGVGGLGVEVAKNLILGGIRQVAVQDTKETTWFDLSSQYYLCETSIGRNRAEASLPMLQELNDSVTVKCLTKSLTEHVVKQYDVIILTDSPLSEQKEVDRWVRAHGKKLLIAETRGLFGMIFADFGPAHIIEDDNGEPCQEVLIEHIDKVSGDVTCLEDSRHGLQDGDYVQFSEVVGMTELNSDAPRRIKVKNPCKFNIGDVSNLSDYVEGGKAKQVKMPSKMVFRPLHESIEDPEFLISDFAKFDRPSQLHLIWQALHAFCEGKNSVPRPHNESDAAEMLQICDKLNGQAPDKTKLSNVDKELVRLFSFQAQGNLIPMTGFIGGIAAQEAMKAVTGIFTPIHQWFYFDALECLPDGDGPFAVNERTCYTKNCRYDGQAVVFGWPYQEALLHQKWFVVGAGAIGCELLKYFANMGVGCGSKGSVFVTDMDNIETSNLNRQFLFRRHDVGSKKSEVAAKAAKCFNRALNITAMCERVGVDTEQILDDSFFANLDGVANALDNVEARTYMDRRCVYYRLPLLESGTQGAKGNVQVVYPYLTESYSSSQDPPEKSIPICTLKNFPNAIEHTIQWARDLFEGLFMVPAELANQFLEDPRGFFERVDKMHIGQKAEMLESVKRVLIDDRPSSAEECIAWARMRWEENFNWQIRQLLHNFPAEQVTLQGVKFWSGSKRCPHPLNFDPNDPTHAEFVYSAAILRAQMYNITPILDRTKAASVAATQQPPSFVPKSGVRIAVTDMEASQQDMQNGVEDDNRFQELHLALAKLKPEKGLHLTPIDFEKDDDTNHHMDFITAASNLRATNYSIEQADLLKTKQIAGRIIPAIATTTAAIAGLAVFEFYKIVAAAGKVNLSKLKNGFVNLALPYFGFAEPVAAPKRKYYDKEWTLWDCIDVEGDMTLQQFLDYMKQQHRLEVTMLSQGVSMLYSFFMPLAKRQQRMPMTITQLVESITGHKIPSFVKALVLEPMCSDDQGEDVEVPYIRYKLPKANMIR